MTLFEGLMMLRSVWEKDVSAEIIKNAWHKSGIRKDTSEEEPTGHDDEVIGESFVEGLDAAEQLEDNEPVMEEPEVDI